MNGKKVISLVLTLLLLITGCSENKYEISTSGMGTVISQTLYGGSETEASRLIEIFDEIEAASSLNIDGSAAQLLNETGSTTNEMLIEQADICLSVYRQSEGAFDFSIEPITNLWQIGTENARVPSQNEIDDALGFVDSSKISILSETENSGGDDKAEETLVLKLGENQRVNFGAIGKGYACDKAKEYLQTTNIKQAVISVGGSVLFYGEKTGGWNVGVKSPFDQTKLIGTFKISGGFVSTSGSYERYFVQDGVTYHHIFNPENGYPVENGLVSVTVFGANGALCDALSTACFVLGEEKGKALLEYYGFGGIFIYGDGSESNISVCGGIDFKEG